MKQVLKDMLVIALALIGAIYLVYPSLGIFELIPDALPLVGSLDEAGATALLLNGLAYYGINVTNLYGKRDQKQKVIRRVVRHPVEDPTTADDTQATR